MIRPTQYENMQSSTVVLGADVLQKLKGKKYNIDDLFSEIRRKREISINQFMNALTFLWVVDAIEYRNFTVSLKKSDVSN
jgi:hypothetical protein